MDWIGGDGRRVCSESVASHTSLDLDIEEDEAVRQSNVYDLIDMKIGFE